MIKSQRSHPHFLFARCCPEENRCWFLVQDGSIFRMLQCKDDKWIQRAIPWDAVALCGILQPTLELFIIGVGGDVMRASPAGFLQEKIQTPEADPARIGMLRDARYIGGAVHVVGMARQVYRRQADGQWISLGHVMRSDSKIVRGFHSVDGFGLNQLIAVGLNGEIWRYTEYQWKQLDSPTNVSLNRVRCLHDNSVYICGQSGVLIRILGDSIEILADKRCSANLYGLALFHGHIYVSSEKKIFKLIDDDLIEVNIGLGSGFTSGQLEVNGNTLWSVGAHHIATTTDGSTWVLQVCPL